MKGRKNMSSNAHKYIVYTEKRIYNLGHHRTHAWEIKVKKNK